MKEEFIAITGYEGIYEISNTGKVNSLKKNKILKPSLGRTGYYRVVLYNNGQEKTFNIHRLVAQGFLGLEIEDKKTVVMHIDDDGLNNNLLNLKLGTFSDNMIDASSKGRLNNFNNSRRITDETVKIIRESEKRTCEIAKEYGLSWNTVHYIRIGKTYVNKKTECNRIHTKNELKRINERKEKRNYV